jgi:HK97 family phage major capsid protein
MKTIKQLREERASLVEKMQALLNGANAEGRAMNTEEEAQWNKMDNDVNALGSQIQKLERQEELNREMAQRQEANNQTESRTTDRAELERRAVLNFLTKGMNGLDAEERSIIVEKRAQGTGTAAAGGVLVPTTLANQIIDSMKAFGGVRQVANVLSTAGGGALNFPTSDQTTVKGAIIAENSQVADQDMTLGSITINGFTYTSKIIKVSNELLQDSAFNLEAYIREKIAERIGRATEEHFTTGTGSGQPQGVVTGSAKGADAAMSAITSDNLVDLIHSVNSAYRISASWMLNDTSVKAIKKLKDSNGLPLWQPSMQAGTPDTLLGYRYVVNDEMASIGASAKSVLYGDFSKYLIRDVQGIFIQRLSERYADFNQTAFLAFSRHDGKLLDSGAIKHLLHAAV